MVTKTYFTELVQTHFRFLEQEYRFSFVRADSTERQISVYYLKKDLMIIVDYSCANFFIDITIDNDVHEVIPQREMMHTLQSRVKLMDILSYHNPEFDYLAIMPKIISLEDSVKKTAVLLNQYGDAILKGDEWITWKLLSGYNLKSLR